MFFTDRYNVERYNFNPGNLEFCCENKPTVNIGHSQKNKTLIYYCSDAKCECHKAVSTQFPIKEIVQKLKSKESEGWEPHLKVVDYYNSCIKSLQLQRNKLLRKINEESPPRLCQDEINLLKFLENGIPCFIPKYMWEEGIKQILGDTQSNRIERELVRIEKDFVDVALRLRRLWEKYDDISSFADFVASRDGMQQKILMEEFKTNTSLLHLNIDGRIVKATQIKKQDLKDVTGIHVEGANINIICGLLSMCPKLSIYQQKSNSISLAKRILQGNSTLKYQTILTLDKFQNIQKIAISLENGTINQTLALLSSKFPLLSDLKITTKKLYQDSLQILSRNQQKFKRLSFICVLGGNNDVHYVLQPLQKFTNLEYLSINASGDNENYRLNFSSFVKLKTLDLTLYNRYYSTNNEIQTTLSTISAIRSLKQLAIHIAVQKQTIQEWAKHGLKVQIIKLSNPKDSFAHLGNIITLKDITFDNVDQISDEDIFTLCPKLENLEHLKILLLSYGRGYMGLFSYKGVACLCQYNTKLKTLHLNNQAFGNLGAMLIGKHLPLLEDLQLKQCEIQDAGFAYLSRLKNLTHFEIGQNGLGKIIHNNRGAKFRFNLPKLKKFIFMSFSYDSIYSSTIYRQIQLTKSLKNELIYQMNSDINIQEVDGVKEKAKIWLEVKKEQLELNNYLDRY